MANPVDVVNIDIYRYSTYTHTYDVVDADEEGVDVVLYTARMEIRETFGSDILHTATTGNSQIFMNADDSLDLIIPGEQIGLWDFDIAIYDLFITAPSGNDYAIARGKVRVYPNVTIPA